jgi:hypothetical protein
MSVAIFFTSLCQLLLGLPFLLFSIITHFIITFHNLSSVIHWMWPYQHCLYSVVSVMAWLILYSYKFSYFCVPNFVNPRHTFWSQKIHFSSQWFIHLFHWYLPYLQSICLNTLNQCCRYILIFKFWLCVYSTILNSKHLSLYGPEYFCSLFQYSGYYFYQFLYLYAIFLPYMYLFSIF